MHLPKPFPVLLLLFLGLSGCILSDDDLSWRRPPTDAPVYVPVYATPEELLHIEKQPAKAIERPAKIFTYNQYLIVNIRNEGFHVIDNADPSRPRNLFFVSVPGNNDVAIKDGVIYADNYRDVVAFTIEQAGEIVVQERLENVISENNAPPFENVYFECPDPSKGIVVDWVLGNVDDPKCYK